MNNLEVKENEKIEDMIYEIRNNQVMFDSKLSVSHDYIFDKIITHYDIGNPISVCKIFIRKKLEYDRR